MLFITLGEFDADIIGAFDKGNCDPRTNFPGFTNKLNPFGPQIGGSAIHIIHQQPKVIESIPGIAATPSISHAGFRPHTGCTV